ncbi:hypothetical protein L7F22_006363 [Adiantum nelumboides]|nr:hypothetical protein [Adiantum nelumboides]
MESVEKTPCWKIKTLALTNFDTERLQIILENEIPIVSNQVQNSVVDTRPQRKMAELCQLTGVKLITYGTVMGGLLSEKFLDTNISIPFVGSSLNTPSLNKYKKMVDTWGGWSLYQELLRTLKRISLKHGVSIPTVAVRYVLNQRYSVSPAVLASTGTNLMALVGLDDIPTWGPRDFLWLRPGETCRYLGFQVGLDVSPKQQFSPVMQSMRRKLCYWSTRHLYMAGRALVANQVLLASAWYVASCWTLHSGVMLQLRCLIRNFLFGGSDGTLDTRARVRWSTVILPTSQGSLGIIDREMESRALLTKLIVRGLFPGNEPWKMLLQ